MILCMQVMGLLMITPSLREGGILFFWVQIVFVAPAIPSAHIHTCRVNNPKGLGILAEFCNGRIFTGPTSLSLASEELL